MNINKKRHKLLAILSEQYLKASFESDKLGVNFETIKANLKVSDNELLLIFTHLKEEEEAGYFSVGVDKGIHITDKGVASFTTKKYLAENEKIFFERLKNWIQTLVPVLSLLATILVIILAQEKIKDKQEDINALQQRMTKLELMIKNHIVSTPAIKKK